MPWARAIALCGTEERMLRGVKANVSWGWRTREMVPAEHVLAIYEQRVKEAKEEPPAEPPPPVDLTEIREHAIALLAAIMKVAPPGSAWRAMPRELQTALYDSYLSQRRKAR